jgi:beta-phosphoglucomutase
MKSSKGGKMPLKAVIFDMDGVLCATDDYHFHSWEEAISEYGIPFTRQDNHKLRGLTRRRSLETLLNGRRLSEKQFNEILKQKNQVFLEMVKEMGEKDLLPGVKRLLDELLENKLSIGVASASRNTGPVLKQLGIDAYMDAVCDGNTIRRSKPAPDVFLETAGALNILPSECLVLEDSQAGVQAARAAGICVVGLGPEARLQDAAAVFPSLEGVSLDLLKKIHSAWISSPGQLIHSKHPYHLQDR